MPTPTYVALATTTLGATASSVTFSSISGSYRDLVLSVDYDPTANGVFNLTFNGASTGFNRVRMFGGSILGAYSDATTDSNVGEYKTTDTKNSILIQVMDYSATDKHKTSLIRSTGLDRVMAYAQRWANTDAITSLTVTTSGAALFGTGSTFSLYGIEA